MKLMIGISPDEKIAKKVARLSKIKYTKLDVSKFPDNEFHIRFKEVVKNKIIYLSLYNPNEKIIEVLFTALSAKEFKAKKVVLISPYLPYLREDKEFHKGEVVSARVFAKLISMCVDELITIDPHLHRIKDLSEVFSIKTTKLSAVQPIVDYIKSNYKNPIITGPDEESNQWAESAAKLVNCPVYVFKKKRYNAKKVKVTSNIKEDLSKYNVIIVDDIISTGHTIEQTINNLKKKGAKNIICICVHGIFTGNSLKRLNKTGAKIITTNSIQNKKSKIDLSKMIANKIK